MRLIKSAVWRLVEMLPCPLWPVASAAVRLRAARLGGRRDLRIKPEWVDAALESTAEPVEVTPLRRVG